MAEKTYIYRIESIESWTTILHSKGRMQIAGELSTEGFIHCSNKETLLLPANKYYQGRKDLVVLEIDVNQVEAEIRYVDLKGSRVKYPHVFGPINTNAVMRVIDFPCNEDGMYSMPDTII